MPIEACVNALWKRRSLASSSRTWRAASSASRSAASTRLLRIGLVRLLLAEEVVQRRQQHRQDRHRDDHHPDAAYCSVRKSRHATDALPAKLMPTQPKLAKVSPSVGHLLRLRYGTAVMSTVLSRK